MSCVDSSYESALKELYSHIHMEKIIPCTDPNLLRFARIEGIRRGLNTLGISDNTLERLRIVHVTGSKGKGTTCATIEAILRKSGYKTGFMSSPHLVSVEERIRINGHPINKKYFGKLFWHVHNCLQETTQNGSDCTYLQYITLMACLAFCLEQVDAVIMEVGIGGRYDHTNFFSKPAVSVVTGIQLEHTEVLGTTTKQIARNKAGIFKAGCPALVPADIPKDLLQIFQEEADTVGCPLYLAPCLEDIKVEGKESLTMSALKLDVSGPWSLRSRSMAMGLAATDLWLRQVNGTKLPGAGVHDVDVSVSEGRLEAAAAVRWPGRWHIVPRGKVTYFLDGAHTNESIEYTANWFQSNFVCDGTYPLRILVFTVIGNRDPRPMLQCLQRQIQPALDLVVFANPHAENSVFPQCKQSKDAECLSVWEELQHNTSTAHCPCIRIQSVSSLIDWFDHPDLSVNPTIPLPHHQISQRGCHVLVTGSLYLVGAILGALREPI